MNKTLAIAIGAGVGASIGWFVGSVIVEIIKIKENPFYDEEYHDTEEFPQDGEDMNMGIDDEDKEPMSKKDLRSKRVKNYTQYFQSQDRPDLAALAAKYNNEEVDETIEDEVEFSSDEDEFEMPEDGLEEDKDIQIISMSEFANDDSEEFQYQTLKFFNDDVVTDEYNNPIDRPEQIIGDEALVSFGLDANDPDSVYVRNKPKKVLYEIVRTNTNYTADPHTHRLQQKKRMKPDRIDLMGEDGKNEEANP